MKRIYSFVVTTLMSSIAFAQLPVSQTPSNRKFVLEEFTGFKCTFCPDGHKIANQIIDANPNNAFAINIHTTSSFSNPGPGQPDYRTPDGDAISNMPGMGITGFPQGACNRITYGSAMAVSRSTWANNANTILAQPSYVNVAGEATLNVATRQLTIDIEVYYTANSPQSTNKYTVALIQNNINGPQTSGNTNPAYMNPDGTYRHMHMLRDILTTSALGDNIPTTTAGTLFANTITYTVPSDFNEVPVELADLELVVFVTETDRNIMTAAKAPISYTGFTTTNDVSLANLINVPDLCVNTITPNFKLKNEGSANITSANIEYSVNGGTPQVMNWTGNLGQLQSTQINLNPITFNLQPTNNLSIEVLSVNGVADDNTANNTGTESFVETNSLGNTVNFTVQIVQDRYGSETTWKILQDNGTTVASGGPYQDLSSNGTLTHNHNVVVPAAGCYIFEIYDSYGDGINSGYGVGSAKMTDGQGLTIYQSNGIFSDKLSRQFKVTSNNNTTAGINELTQLEFNIYPNPAIDHLSLNWESMGGDYKIRITDIQGRNIFTLNEQSTFGKNTVDIPISGIAPGAYLVSITSDGVTQTQQVVIQ